MILLKKLPKTVFNRGATPQRGESVLVRIIDPRNTNHFLKSDQSLVMCKVMDTFCDFLLLYLQNQGYLRSPISTNLPFQYNQTTYRAGFLTLQRKVYENLNAKYTLCWYFLLFFLTFSLIFAKLFFPNFFSIMQLHILLPFISIVLGYNPPF